MINWSWPTAGCSHGSDNLKGKRQQNLRFFFIPLSSISFFQRRVPERVLTKPLMFYWSKPPSVGWMSSHRLINRRQHVCACANSRKPLECGAALHPVFPSACLSVRLRPLPLHPTTFRLLGVSGLEHKVDDGRKVLLLTWHPGARCWPRPSDTKHAKHANVPASKHAKAQSVRRLQAEGSAWNKASHCFKMAWKPDIRNSDK